MTRYLYLVCPEADGTQHWECPHRTDGFTRNPTEDEIHALACPPNILERPEEELRQWRTGPGATYTPVFDPSPCCFEKLDPDGRQPDWPTHVYYHPRSVQYFPGWPGTEHYPEIRRLYRCTVHHTPPAKVYIRHWPWQTIQDRIKNQFYRIVRKERTAEDHITMFGHPGQPTPTAYWWYRPQYTYWTPRRDPPRTAHDVW